MIKCCTVNELGSFSKIGTLLEKRVNQLNDDGCKILNIFETKTTKVPNTSDQEFVIVYDDCEKISSTEELVNKTTDLFFEDYYGYDAIENQHTCGRCKYEKLPENAYPCKFCMNGPDRRYDFWEAKEDE